MEHRTHHEVEIGLNNQSLAILRAHEIFEEHLEEAEANNFNSINVEVELVEETASVVLTTDEYGRAEMSSEVVNEYWVEYYSQDHLEDEVVNLISKYIKS